MSTLYLRNVPEEVIERLRRLASKEGMSVNAVAVRELAEVTRRADNPTLLGALPDLDVDPDGIVAGLEADRAAR
ncbi:MAG: FitA-like ribbon-helix-helix domain-containing protein [Actinomycetota bacterium]